jgi:hypothetical protein
VPSRRRHRPGGEIRGAVQTCRPAPGGTRLLIDGRNVQRALERGSSTGALPTATLIARLRAAFPPPTVIELVLDGHPGGSPRGRIAPGVSVDYSRGRTADQVIGDRVVASLRELGPAGAWSVTVVSDDHEVREHARRHGAQVEGAAWLEVRLEAGAGRGASIGHGRKPRRSVLG